MARADGILGGIRGKQSKVVNGKTLVKYEGDETWVIISKA